MDADRTVLVGGDEARPSNLDALAQSNLNAFLMCVRACEGTAGPDGYRTLFGGKLFDDFAEHPNVRTSFRQTDGTYGFTTAAGAYQIIFSTWDRLRRKLGLPDFSPASQDRAAIELITERNALDAARAGDVREAIGKCWPVWASLPGSTYLQPTRAEAFALNAYTDAGGVIV